ncbi:hypothetical protein GWO43_11155 [candidate division KSB1 bacterium]|nr:hypothetical protein [candidate division KSB1 bacterium]NIV69635.1 hypothetical protein [Phycisphaerae bacterium]NIR70374.1 hypothetical protein [candidate division KSB1 bacterium]NIS24498.1 hypothetical protein [candidate division KSB1 bacterium]NIT71426.1 hypothetical protein [candidate division KSB1 bacterium]
MTDIFIPRDKVEHQESAELNSLLKLFQKRLYRTALILTKSPHAARDLLQEVYLRARQEYQQLTPNTHFGLWLSQLLINIHLGRTERLSNC